MYANDPETATETESTVRDLLIEIVSDVTDPETKAANAETEVGELGE